MIRVTRDENGFVLISAIVLLTVIMGLGIGLLLFTDNQQSASGKEQAGETAFNVAEAALNAQVGQVSRAWPAKKKEGEPFEAGCTPSTSTATNGCPTAESMKMSYPQAGTTNCPAGLKDSWGSPASNQWTTYVRDDGAGTSYFNSSAEKLEPAYDLNGDNKVWVRTVGVVQCRVVELATLVSRQEVAANFPKTVMSGNWFRTGNKGKGGEPIVEGESKEAGQAGEVRMRCNGFSVVSECEEYVEGQVHAKVNPPPGAPTPTMTTSQLLALRQAAEAEGTYYGPGNCPNGLPPGKPAYVQGPCAVSGGGNEVGNSKEKPGFLVIVNGTFGLGGTAEFFGTVYCVNAQESSNLVVKVGGNSNVIGELIVDGNGGMEVGQSHKRNVEYDPRSAAELKLYAGATSTRNSFRVLSQGE